MRLGEMDEEVSVLHVDDEPSLLELSRTFLQREHPLLSVDTTTEPEKGPAKISNGGYDVLVSDYKMPEMDGLEILQVVRELPRPNLRLLMSLG